jgi:hypothetical protein
MFITWFADWSREVSAKDLPILTAGTSWVAAGLMVIMLFVKLCFSLLKNFFSFRVKLTKLPGSLAQTPS